MIDLEERCSVLGCGRTDRLTLCRWDGRPFCPAHGPEGAKRALCDKHRRLIARLLQPIK